MAKKIVVIGSLNYDIILKIPRLPECGETLPADPGRIRCPWKRSKSGGAGCKAWSGNLYGRTCGEGCTRRRLNRIGTEISGKYRLYHPLRGSGLGWE